MQKIVKGLAIVLPVLFLASCSKKVDNYPGPTAGFQGRIIDSTTNANILTETSGIQIKLEELSWSATPTPQYIPSKPDGTFQDTRLFSGHYRVTPANGAFWPVAGVELDIKGTTTKDFVVTPYLKIANFTYSLSGTTLIMRFNLVAPITQGLPQIIDVRPFVNTTPFVGSGATIGKDYTEPNKVGINSNWSDVIAATTYEVKVPNLKSGRTFYARVGVRVNDSYKQCNYSEVITVPVP